jgi:chaperonin GroES
MNANHGSQIVMTMKVTQLLGNRILVKQMPRDAVTPGGIHLAEAHKPEQFLHLVLAVGPGRRLKDGSRAPIDIVPGEHIMLDQFALQDRTDVGDGCWIVDANSACIAYP